MIALLLSLSSVVGSAFPAGDAADSILRVYDLSNLDWSSPGEGDPLAVALLPGLDFWESPKEGVGEDDASYDVESIIDLIYRLCDEEFQYEGRRLEETGSGQLLVVGPEALHQRIALVLEFLEGVLHSHADLAIDVWTLPAGREVPALAPMAPLAQVDAWTAQLNGLGGEHASYELQVRAGHASVLKLTRDVHAVLDYDVEIAQGSTIADPVLGTASVGTRLAVRAAPSADGLHLALTWKRGDLLDIRKGREVHSGFLLSTPQNKPAFFDEANHITDLCVLSRSAALATHLPGGHALVLETSAALERAGVREFLVLRQVGGGLPVARTLELDGEGGQLFFGHLGAIAPPSCVHDGVLLWPGLVFENLDRRLWRSPLLSAGLRRPNTDTFTTFLDGLGGGGVSVDVKEPWVVVRPSVGGRGASGTVARLRERFEQMLAPLETLDVRVCLEQAGKDAVVARLPVRVGTSCSVVIGVEEFEQPDYDVEVAQFAATEDPTVYTAFDGLVLFLDPLVGSGGQLSMRVRGGGHLLLGRERVDLGGVIPGRVDQSEYAHLFVNETVALRPEGDTWRRVFGKQAGASGARDLTLRIEVRRP